MADGNREHWSAGLGFTMAAVGSAVGLGNMWRFSYMAAENGGAAFVFLYVLLTLLVGLPLLLTELAMGRGAARSPVQALIHYGGQAWAPLGLLFVVAGFVILAYYGVLSGWTLRYTLEALWQGFPEDAGAHFVAIREGHPAALWHVGFMAVTTFVISGGVQKGIERVSTVLMPLLGLLVLGLAGYAATLDGAGDGYRYYFTTEFSAIFNAAVFRDAAGQAFFSLSLGMGAILTYASYLSRERNLPRESVLIAASDFAVAFIAGLVVFPLVFALGLQEDVGASTLGALFVTLPKAFASMGDVGRVFGFLFMLALVFGALTSAMSLLEVVVSTAIDTLGWTRPKAAWVCGGAITLLGLLAAYDINKLDLMDKIGGNLLLVLGGLFLSIFGGWIIGPQLLEEAHGEADGEPPAVLRLWLVMMRFVIPLILATVLYYSALDSWSALSAMVSG